MNEHQPRIGFCVLELMALVDIHVHSLTHVNNNDIQNYSIALY